MPRYAYMNETGDAILREKSYPDPLDPAVMVRKSILEIFVTDPPFDPDTQIRTGPVETIQADRIDRVYTVRDKTAQEIDDEKEANAVARANTPTNRALVLYAAEQAGKDITNPTVVTAELQRAKEIFKTQL